MAALKWSDIWLLQSLRFCGECAERIDMLRLVEVADRINHAILTFEEFNNGLYRLHEAGLIELRLPGPGYALTNKTITLFRRFSRQSYLKQRESIWQRLGAEEWSKDYNPNVLESPQVFVPKEDFDNAVSAYLKRYGL